MATYRFKFELTEVGDPIYSKRIRAACDKLGCDANQFALIATKMAADLMAQDTSNGYNIETEVEETSPSAEGEAATPDSPAT
jgi:hypothetical protein